MPDKEIGASVWANFWRDTLHSTQCRSRRLTLLRFCHRLRTRCERKKRAAEALSHKGLVPSWHEITRPAQEQGRSRPEPAQAELS